jgi:hypothetical protein
MDIIPSSLNTRTPIGAGLSAGAAIGTTMGQASQAKNPLLASTNFQDMLSSAGAPSKQLTEKRKAAEKAAAGLVSQALILPILKQLRQSTWSQDGPFSPGIGEKTFGPHFDMQLADRIAQSPRLGIKNALTDRLMQRSLREYNSPAGANGKALNVHG